MLLRKLKNFYDGVYKKGEEKHFTNLSTTGTITEETNEILKLSNWKSKKILDVGCGTGFFSYKAAKKGATVLGIDFSVEAIEIAQEKYCHPHLKYKQMDVKKIKDKYDVIIITLPHQDFITSKAKIKKILSPKGMIFDVKNKIFKAGKNIETL